MFNKKMDSEHSDSLGGSTGPNPNPSPNPAPAVNPPQSTSGPSSGGPSPSVRGGASTILAEGSKFVGNTNVSGTYRIEGNAEGDIAASDSLVVGKTGNVQAKVTTKRAVLNGRFQGKIEASDRVELQAGSRVEADIKAQNMVMEDGVQFQGNCRVGK